MRCHGARQQESAVCAHQEPKTSIGPRRGAHPSTDAKQMSIGKPPASRSWRFWWNKKLALSPHPSTFLWLRLNFCLKTSLEKLNRRENVRQQIKSKKTPPARNSWPPSARSHSNISPLTVHVYQLQVWGYIAVSSLFNPASDLLIWGGGGRSQPRCQADVEARAGESHSCQRKHKCQLLILFPASGRVTEMGPGRARNLNWWHGNVTAVKHTCAAQVKGEGGDTVWWFPSSTGRRRWRIIK